ncbi:MAG: thiamine phosphate synthase [Bacteroidota bacterium]
MKQLILFSQPQLFEGEVEIINELMTLGKFNFHIRKKLSSRNEIANLVESIEPKFRKRIVIHQYFEQAEEYGLFGIHLPESDRWSLSGIEGKKHNLISTSIHDLSQYGIESKNYKYVFYSPVFTSVSKSDYHPALNLNQLEMCLNELKPTNLVALGGVKIENFKSALKLGFNGVALLGSVWQSENPVSYLSEFIKAFNGVSR